MYSLMIMDEDNIIGLTGKVMRKSQNTSMRHLVLDMGQKSSAMELQSKVQGKSGVRHQIDVLTEQVDGDKVLLTAIECKLWKTKVTKKIVMELSQSMGDADIASRIIVTKTGFTRDTLTFTRPNAVVDAILAIN